MFLKEIFSVTDKIMLDNDDLVRKGVGWVLKEASRKHEQEVKDYLMKWKDLKIRNEITIDDKKYQKYLI